MEANYGVNTNKNLYIEYKTFGEGDIEDIWLDNYLSINTNTQGMGGILIPGIVYDWITASGQISSWNNRTNT